MRRYIEGINRSQSALFPESLDDYICEDNPVRAIDVFVEELDLVELGLKEQNRKLPAGPATTRRRC